MKKDNSLKTVLCLALTLIMLLGFLPSNIAVTAEASTGKYGPLVYKISDGKVTVTACDQSVSGTVTVPSSIAGYPVVTIAKEAFYCCQKITGVVVEDGVMIIEDEAFRSCSSLNSISLPDSITSVGWEAFDNTGYYNNQTNWNNDVLYIDKVLIGSKIGSLVNVELIIKDGTICIADYAFDLCKLSSVTIPGSVKNIGKYAFHYCSYLEKITLEKGIEHIGDSAFYACMFTDIIIPEGVKSIGNFAFEYCFKAKSLSIPKSTTSIGKGAFYDCIDIENIYVHPDNPFYHSKDNCLIKTNEKKLIRGSVFCIIPDDGSVTIIDKYAFGGTPIYDLFIPKQIKTIEKGAFLDCYLLHYITVDENNNFYHSEGDCLIETATKTLIAGSNISKIPADGSVTKIAEHAFRGRYYLERLDIPSTVTEIGDYAFANCKALTSIILPQGITSIGEGVFRNCASLTSVTIPESVKEIRYCAFYGCSILKDVYYTGTESSWNNIATESGNNDLLEAIVHYSSPNSQKIKINILNCPSSKSTTIPYNSTIKLKAKMENAPDSAVICWLVSDINGNNIEAVSIGDTFEYNRNEDAIILAAASYKENGIYDAYLDENDKLIYDYETVYINNGFFSRLIAFFKSLFGISSVVEQ